MVSNYYIFGFRLVWYTFWQYAAIIIVILFALYYCRKKLQVNITIPKLLLMIAGCAFLGYFGARFFSLLDIYTDTGTINKDIVLSRMVAGKLRWYGSILFIFVGFIAFSKLLRIRNWKTLLDFITLKLCLFTAVVKQACFFSGDGCYGTYTNLPWGMYFSKGLFPSLLPVHPTPLYDSLFHLTFFAFLYKWNDRKKYEGQTAVFFFAGTSIFNFAIEFIRRNPDVAFGLTLSQLTYSLILLVTFIYYLKIKQTTTIPKLSQA